MRVLAKPVFFVSLCCAAWSAAAPAVTDVLAICVRICYGDIPCQRFAFCPREQSTALRAFVVFHRQVDRLFRFWYSRVKV